MNERKKGGEIKKQMNKESVRQEIEREIDVAHASDFFL
jgi:hypothetical protein